MVEAGLNVVTALLVLEEQTEDKKLAAVVSEVRATSKAVSCFRRRWPAT